MADKANDKWEFEDYAYTITGIIVALLLVGPELMYEFFGIQILGGSLQELGQVDFIYEIERYGFDINRMRALSPLLFLVTTSIVFIHDAVVAFRNGGYQGTMFSHTFESLFEEAIYITITTVMVLHGVWTGNMFASWLAAPITWVLFSFFFPFLRKCQKQTVERNQLNRLLLILLFTGLTLEFIFGGWVIFPATWLMISFVGLVKTIRHYTHNTDELFNLLYYIFSVILMSLGILYGLWITSWTAFPIALLICWLMQKLKLVRNKVV